MCHIFFIHSSVDGHLGHFHVLAIVNSAVMNIAVHVSFFFLNKFIYLFIFGCAWAFSSCGEQGLLFDVVRGLLIAVASLVEEHGL